MRRIRGVIFIILMTVSACAQAGLWQLKEERKYSLVAPFGFGNRQPPTQEYIKIIDAEIGLEAQQVCGYTDWTTTQIHLPKELLSKTYWKNVGEQIMAKAQKVVMDLSGALPSMLACNVSPTFCSVFNQAELMAAFEQSLTFETCNILDDVANTGAFQSSTLRDCVKKYMKDHSDATNSVAREVCLNKDGGDNPATKADKINKSSAISNNGEGAFDFEKFAKDLFPVEIDRKTKVYYFNRDGHQYSRRRKILNFTRNLFLKGIVVRGSTMYEVAGTFQGSIDKEKDIEQNKLRNAIIVILKEMREYQQKGYSEVEIIRRTEYHWKDKNKWKKDQEPHPIYRPSGDDSEPTYLISPEQMIMLLPLVGENESNFESNDLRQVLDRLASTATHVKITDKLIDTYKEMHRVCTTNPKYQNSVSQKNCEGMLKDINSTLSFMQYQRNMESDAFKAQQEVNEYVRHVQEQNGINRKSESMPPFDFFNYFTPGKY